MYKEPKRNKPYIIAILVTASLLLIYRIDQLFFSVLPQIVNDGSLFTEVISSLFQFIDDQLFFPFIYLSISLVFVFSLCLLTLRAYLHHQIIFKRNNTIGKVNAFVSRMIPVANAFMPFYFLLHAFKAYRFCLNERSVLLSKLKQVKMMFSLSMFFLIVDKLPVLALFLRFEIFKSLEIYEGIITEISTVGSLLTVLIGMSLFLRIEEAILESVELKGHDFFKTELSEFAKPKVDSDYEE